jgi:hypothetical protein
MSVKYMEFTTEILGTNYISWHIVAIFFLLTFYIFNAIIINIYRILLLMVLHILVKLYYFDDRKLYSTTLRYT